MRRPSGDHAGLEDSAASKNVSCTSWPPSTLRLLTQEQTFRTIAEEITDVDICYEMGADRGDRDPLVGRWAPNLTLHLEHGKTDIVELMCVEH
jgi:hypothetical protein